MLRPAQNTSHSTSGPPRLIGVITVIAVALPSMFATVQLYGMATQRGPQLGLDPQPIEPAAQSGPD